MEEKTFGSRCLYAFMGFISASLLSAVGMVAMNSYSRSSSFSGISLALSGVFVLVFTIWGFIDGEKMLSKLTSLWDDRMD